MKANNNDNHCIRHHLALYWTPNHRCGRRVDLFPQDPIEKIVDKAGAQSEHDANRVINEIQAARRDANKGIQKLTETLSTEVTVSAEERRVDDAWKHVNQDHITENSVQHEKMLHIMELMEKNIARVGEGLTKLLAK